MQLVFDRSEFGGFLELVENVSRTTSDVIGVLVTGSLVQRIKLPEPPIDAPATASTNAYELVDSRSKCKLWPHIDSDLGLWVCTADHGDQRATRDYVDGKGMELLGRLATDPSCPSHRWVEWKHSAFDAHYKQASLYPSLWVASQGSPWLAPARKIRLAWQAAERFPALKRRVDCYFKKEFPEGFLQIRASPACTQENATSDFGVWSRLLWSVPLFHGHGKLQMKGA